MSEALEEDTDEVESFSLFWKEEENAQNRNIASRETSDFLAFTVKTDQHEANTVCTKKSDPGRTFRTMIETSSDAQKDIIMPLSQTVLHAQSNRLLNFYTEHGFKSLSRGIGYFNCTDGDFDCKCLQHSLLRVYRRKRQCMIPFIWGILVGVTLSALLMQQHIIYVNSFPWSVSGSRHQSVDEEFLKAAINLNGKSEFRQNQQQSSVKKSLERHSDSELRTQPVNVVQDDTGLKTRLYVGVITAEKFLGTRALAVNNTWGSQVDKVQFFTQQGSAKEYGLPVVNLESASDSEYPPQRKAFEMLKFMCEHHIDDFEWFVRADDDVYIRVEKLRRYLAQIDSDKLIYMGQPGHGVPEVRDRLGLNGHNFCMGGPGVIFNRKALKGLCPHIDSCMKEVVSKEEDVEIGRCVTNHIHIECTHAWETLKLFYHSYQEEYTEEKPFLGNLAENEHVSYALTLHHLKVPYIMYRVHRHYTSLTLNSTIQKLSDIRENLENTNARLPLAHQRLVAVEKSVPAPYKARRLDEVNPWKSFGTDAIYSLHPAHVVEDITNDVLADLKQIGETGIDEAIDHQQVQKFTYSHVSDGYLRSNPLRGTDYLLDVYFSSKHLNAPDEIRRVHLLRPVGDMEVSEIRRSSLNPKNSSAFYVVVVVPRRKTAQLETFLRNYYEPTFLARDHHLQARLVVVPIEDSKSLLETFSTSASAEEIIRTYKAKYPVAQMVTLDALHYEDKALVTSVQMAYARGISFAHDQVEKEDHARSGKSVILLTSANMSLNPALIKACLSRAGASTSSNSHNYYSNYNSLDYRRRKKKSAEGLPPQLYQPIPYRLYTGAVVGPWPTAMVPQGAGLNPGTGDVPVSMLKSGIGFWDESVGLGERDNVVTVPLCGCVGDLFGPASAAVTAFNSSSEKTNFRDALYEEIYAGKLTIVRSPDRALVNIPER